MDSILNQNIYLHEANYFKTIDHKFNSGVQHIIRALLIVVCKLYMFIVYSLYIVLCRHII